MLETVTALMVFAILAVAAYTLLAGAMNTDRYLRAANTTESEIELATRRMTYNLCTAAAMSTPTTLAAGGTLTITTQPDAGNGSQQYTVTYSVNGSSQLVETDSRYSGAGNVICNNVASFAVQLQTLSSPKIIKVTLVTTPPQAVTRSFQVTCRNL